MFVAAEHFLQNLINKYGKHQISTDGGTWYSYVCKFLKIGHHLHSSFEKSIIERAIQYIKDRTENLDDHCNDKNKCKLKHVTSGLHLFVDYYNRGGFSS